LSFAADLVSTALLTESTDDAREAAAFLVEQSGTSSTALALAQRLLNPDGPARETIDVIGAAGLSPEVRHAEIRRLRRQLRESPRNALAWADLAHEYASLGLVEKALRSMDTALRLVPTSRFLLRSGARLFVHADDPERALRLLRQAGRTNADPWLMAAEIATSGVASRSPKFARRGKAALAMDVAPRHKTELASALATLEWMSGDNRSARRLFRDSLIDPTENAVAQAEWASRRLNASLVEPHHLETPGSFEARARESLRRGRFEEALDNSWNWLHDQSFSRDPAGVGSYVAAVALRDYEQSIRILQLGLVANPADWLLLNNMAFALASLNRLDEAQDHLNRIVGERDPTSLAVTSATQGLVQFRRGNVQLGRDRYKEAIRALLKGNFKKSAAVAAVFWAREELLTRQEAAKEAVRRAAELAKKEQAPEIQGWLRALEAGLSGNEPPA